MAADDDPPDRSRPLQACNLCKSRKKKCDRSLPSCGYCKSKQHQCVYGQTSFPRNHAITGPSSFQVPQPSLYLTSVCGIRNVARQLEKSSVDTYRLDVYTEVYRIIRENGQYVDDISAHYFRGFHLQLPIISRTSFYNRLSTSQTVPPADCSLLLLTMFLVTRSHSLGSETHLYSGIQSGDQKSAYLAARSLYAQVQVVNPPSLALIQAGILLAMYEYMSGHPHNAFMTISSIARMAFAAGINRYRCNVHIVRHSPSPDSLIEAEEAANTWWGIVICERIFFGELATFNQPLLSEFPAGNARLPVESDILDQLDILEPGALPNIPLSSLNSPNLGGFSRTAQATCFLDQVRKAFDVEDIDSRILLLARLDTNIQSFLTLVMPQCQGEPGIFCSAMNITIRTLFILHRHILDQLQIVEPKYEPREEWLRKSHEALETVAKMVIDIADLLVATPIHGMTTYMVDAMPPQYPYIARAVLEYLNTKKERGALVSCVDAENVLQRWLDKYSERWSIHG